MYVTKTPLRVSLFGGGADFPEYYQKNAVLVIGGTIDKYVYTSIARLPQGAEQKYRVNYRTTESVDTIDEINHPVIREALRLYADGYSLNISTMSDLVGGSGLGSSSSFTVGFLKCLGELIDCKFESSELWQTAVKLEREILNEAGGIQDQLHATFGGFRCYELSHAGVSSYYLFNNSEDLNFFSEHCLLLRTGGVRRSADYAKQQITNIMTLKIDTQLEYMQDLCKDALSVFHSFSKNNNTISELGSILKESWKLKRSLTSNISNDVIDELADEVLNLGAYGVKLLGAGGSGYLLVLANAKVRQKIYEVYENKLIIPFKFSETGVQVVHI